MKTDSNFPYLIRILVIISEILIASCGLVPEQIHLSLGDSASDMVVTWTTLESTRDSISIYGVDEQEKIAVGQQRSFIDGGKGERETFIHTAVMTNLLPNTSYVYSVGSDREKVHNEKFWSKNYTFRTHPEGSDWELRIAVLGDMGFENAKSVPHLEKEILDEHYQLVLHDGDFAYDMHDLDGRVGDDFMNLIQNIAARVPYMTSVGNHEYAYNFSHYKERFTMPGYNGNLYYSFDAGPVHFISFSAEFYYFMNYGNEQIIRQFVWLENDLKKANKPENRDRHPWIIAFSHRPMYCSNSDDPEHCPNPENRIRVGFPIYDGNYKDYILGLEKLFNEHGVDLIIAAHEHSYERSWPVFNNKVCNGSLSDPYLDPRAPVHIVSGSAGCKEGRDPFVLEPKPWSAFHSDDFGYTRLIIYNSTHLHLDQLSVGKDELEVIDSMTLTKTHPRNPFTCNIESMDKTANWHYIQPESLLDRIIGTGLSKCRGKWKL